MTAQTHSPAENIENHKIMAEYHEEAAKYHHEAVKHHQEGDHDKAAASTLKAHGQHILANAVHNEYAMSK